LSRTYRHQRREAREVAAMAKGTERIKQRLLEGEIIHTFNSTTGVKYTEWFLVSYDDACYCLVDPDPNEHYVMSRNVYESPNTFCPLDPGCRTLDEAAEIILGNEIRWG